MIKKGLHSVYVVVEWPLKSVSNSSFKYLLKPPPRQSFPRLQTPDQPAPNQTGQVGWVNMNCLHNLRYLHKRELKTSMDKYLSLEFLRTQLFQSLLLILIRNLIQPQRKMLIKKKMFILDRYSADSKV